MKKQIRTVALLVVLSLCITNTYTPLIYAKNSKKVTIKLNKTSATIVVGKTLKLKLKNAKEKKVKWRSSNKKIATVKNGIIVAKKVGEVIITAKYNKKRYKAKITVIKKKKKKSERETVTEPENQTKEVVTIPEKVTQEVTTKEPETQTNEKLNGLERTEYLVDEMYDGKNIIVSPMSLDMAIGMTANGAGENEKKDCEDFLGSSLEQYNQDVQNIMTRAKNDEMLSVSNGIWYKSGYQLKQDFKNTVNSYYYPDIFESPMDNSTLNAVNGWAEEKTDGMIKKMLDDISKDTRVILVNALLFIGEWTEKFTSEDVSKADFTDKDGNKKSVDMMNGTESVYYENNYATGFEKKYGKGEYSFIAILPKKTGDFSLSDLKLDSFLNSRTDEYKVQLKLPKFTYEWKDEGRLTETLKKTKLKSLFNEETNPLGNMFANATDSIYVSDVKQSCKIILNETGTKAAAVTVVIAKENSVFIDPSKIKQVYLNRPFAYLIKDNKNNEVVFMGKVVSIHEQ